MLMVGALQCRNVDPAGGESYNTFVARQRAMLDAKAYVLKSHFLRENGVAQGRAAYDEYNTAMSNRHAGRTGDPSFCGTIASYTRMAATSSDHDLVVLAEAVIEPPASSCTAGYAARAPLPARRVEPVPAVAVATEGDDDFYHGVAVPAPYAALPPVMPAVAYAPATLAERAPVPAAPVVAAPPPAEPMPAEPMPAVAYAPPVPVAPPPALVPVAAPPAGALPVPVASPPAPSAVPSEPPAPLPAAPAAAPVRVAAIPTTVIAPAPVIPPQEAKPAPSPADALQAAIAALQAATEALKASQQTHPTN